MCQVRHILFLFTGRPLVQPVADFNSLHHIKTAHVIFYTLLKKRRKDYNVFPLSADLLPMMVRCIKQKKPRKFVTCKALYFALQDGLEPTTP